MGFRAIVGLLLLTFLLPHVGSFAGSEKVLQIDTATFSTCVLRADSLKCVGDNTYGQTLAHVPLNGGIQVAHSEQHTCVLDSEGVWCWGLNEYGQAQVPHLIQPKQIAVGEWHSCALDEAGVTCWGAPPGGNIPQWDLKGATHIAATGYSTCVHQNNRIRCWGIAQPEFETKNLVRLTAGLNHYCATDDFGLRCWGDNVAFNKPNLKSEMEDFSTSASRACAIVDGKHKCWGMRSDIPSRLKEKITKLSVGRFHSCVATTGNMIRCWGSNKYGETNVDGLAEARD